jgi:hypothetical protein
LVHHLMFIHISEECDNPMDKMRTRSCVTPFFILAILAVLPVMLSAGSAEAGAKQRPPVSFPHEMHFDVADDCLSCHHDYQDGENALDEELLFDTEPDEEMDLNSMNRDEIGPVSCVSCHGDDAKMGPMDAFHNQCITCHEVQKAGPVMCGECHVKP